MPEDTRKKVTVFIAEDLHRPARTKIADLDTSFQSVLVGLLEGWVRHGAARGPAEPVREVQGYGKFQRWHDQLQEIFESGDREAITAVQQNILVFHRIVGQQQPAAAPAVEVTKKARR